MGCDYLEEKPNVLLITIDCLRPDHLGVFGYSRETSPNIDKFANMSKNFKMAFSHGGATEEAFPTMLTGVPPPIDIEQCDIGIRRGTNIAKILKDSGYITAAFNSNPFLSHYWGYANDFDTFYHNLKRGVERHHTVTDGGISAYLRLATTTPPIIRGKEITDRAVSWINAAKAPFFAWLHYMDTHMPYLPPREFVNAIGVKPTNRFYMLWLYRKMYASNKRVYLTRDSNQSTLKLREVSNIVDYYDGGIRYVDSCFGLLLQSLEEQNRFRDTLVILTADHGELLGEKGMIDHGLLYDQVIHVPLMISGTDIACEVVKNPVTHLVIGDTIKTAVFGKQSSGIQSEDSFASFGRGMISTAVDHNRRIYSCRTQDWKYIETIDLASNQVASELYDLASDPNENKDVSEYKKELALTFHNRVRSFVENNSTNPGVTREPFSKREEAQLQRNLRELGYE